MTNHYPITHLLPGISDMIFVAIKLEMNVQTAIQGIAITVGNAKLCLNKAAHNPNQNICIRYIP